MTLPMTHHRPIRALVAAAALATVTVPGVAAAAGPWTTSSPGGATYTAPAAGIVLVRISTSDAYPGREAVAQAYELVVLRTLGVEVGRTPDLPDRVASATAAASFTVTVSAGQVLEVVHSSKVGLVDGTPNSVTVATRFDFAPASTTTSTTASSTVPPAPSTTIAATVPSAPVPIPTDPAASVAATTTAVDVGTPPVPPTAVVDPPRPPRTDIASTPTFTLPDTGSRTTEAIAVLAVLVVLLGGLGVLLGRGPADLDPSNRGRGLDGLLDDIRGGQR